MNHSIILYPDNNRNSMKTKFAKSFIVLAAVPAPSDAAASNGPVSYLIGGIIALLIMGYLIYTLLRPEKF
jgi:K+-transporting ATPase KdpF subunit